MKIISGITDFQLNSNTAVAIGKFDGVHLGHRVLIEQIVSLAAADPELKSVVFTFNPSPESLFAGHALPELTTVSEKRMIFDRMGVDVLIEFPMNMDTAAITAEDFIGSYLVERMQAVYICAGSDVTFGYKGEGNAQLLSDLSREYDYRCYIHDKVTYKDIEISSTRIRDELDKGNMREVTALLGTPYRITGTVSHGRNVGHSIGIPTANVIVPPDKMTGPNGVYYSRVYTKDKIHPAITNIGVKPTIIDDELLCCESYLYGFDGDLYGDYIEVELLEFVRPECKFKSIGDLKDHMERDIIGGLNFHHILK